MHRRPRTSGLTLTSAVPAPPMMAESIPVPISVAPCEWCKTTPATCQPQKGVRRSSPARVTRVGSRHASTLRPQSVEFIDADEHYDLRWSPARSVTTRCVWLSAASFFAAAVGRRLIWVVQALSAIAEPLGAAATIPKLVLSCVRAVIGPTGEHVYRSRSTFASTSRQALLEGRTCRR